MRLLSLTCQRFRNLSEVTLAPSPHTTVAVGENGQGKTNLLEALYFLATLKPLRAGRLSELVQFGAVSAKVTGRFLLSGAEREIAVEVVPGGRTALVDGKRAASLESYFGGVSVVAFTPDDLAVVKGGPDGRRAFLDRSVFNRFPAYLEESREYARALKSRNRLLKDNAPVSHLQAWDATLARVGARLWARRRQVVGEVAPRARDAFARIGRTEEGATFSYAPSHLPHVDFAASDEAQLQQALGLALDVRLRRDLERGFTSVGPHADDLELALGQHAARQYASQGQARALVLAWKVAEIENLEASNGFLPLLLLDDVSSELDPERNAFLMGYLAERGAQTFLTTTDAHLVQRAVGPDTVWYRVSGGQVSRREA
ncbi:MAG: DNA replication/repair protein RecF [Myxococcales bacterium]|nr:DNA replication/repair protein RecF [Myxococcales bacterium]